MIKAYLSRYVSISTVAILSEEGIKARYSYTGSLTAKLFVLYLETSVLPILEDGQTLIMDRHPRTPRKNCSKLPETK
ncbi:MAG TPA: hypothetical protein VLR54_03170 [Methanobacteriaceae archaeon]|nr:hypothetical protein [Methanobacteriaceae archaeon]